jgi:hypothetical protein
LRRLALTLLLLAAVPIALAQQQLLNIGSEPNNGTGDPLRTAGQKINANETALFDMFGAVGLLKGNGAAPNELTAATWADVATLLGGTPNSSCFVRGDGNCVALTSGTIPAINLAASGNGGVTGLLPFTNLATMPGGWSGLSNAAPILQNATFTGSTTNSGAAFGMFLQQTDNSSVTSGQFGYGVGFSEHLILNGSSVVGNRTAGNFYLDLNAATGNTSAGSYVALIGKCNYNATDAHAGACFGFNSVASVGASVTVGQVIGAEFDTWTQTGATITDRIGAQVVDISGGGVQASTDDVGFSINNQYGPSSNLGYKVGFELGRAGGNFPVETNGTMFYAQGNNGAGFTVANGIDWHLGTFTGNSWNDGMFTISSAGFKAVGAANVPIGNVTDGIGLNVVDPGEGALVNSLQLSGGATGNVVKIIAAGGDANVSMYLQTNGTGKFIFRPGSDGDAFNIQSANGATTYFDVNTSAGGVVAYQLALGTATGGFEGAGTINTQGVYANGAMVITSAGAVRPAAFTISGLPTCNSGAAGTRAYVTNGVASPTFFGTVSTTGSSDDPVYCTGSGWVYD